MGSYSIKKYNIRFGTISLFAQQRDVCTFLPRFMLASSSSPVRISWVGVNWTCVDTILLSRWFLTWGTRKYWGFNMRAWGEMHTIFFLNFTVKSKLIFNPISVCMALGSTQPLTEMSTRCISWG